MRVSSQYHTPPTVELSAENVLHAVSWCAIDMWRLIRVTSKYKHGHLFATRILSDKYANRKNTEKVFFAILRFTVIKPDNFVSEQATQRSVRSPSRKEMRCVCRWSKHAVQGKVWCPAPHRVVETGEIFLLEFIRFWTNLLWCPGGPSRDLIISWPPAELQMKNYCRPRNGFLLWLRNFTINSLHVKHMMCRNC